MTELVQAGAAWLAATDAAVWLRSARWGYALVSAAHVLGIALLIGAIVPMDLRLVGLWRGVSVQALARVLVPVAACGLVLASGAGVLLFSVRAPDYLSLAPFQAKMALVGLGTVSALALHLRHGLWLGSAQTRHTRLAGLLSLLVWPTALVAGRLIAFADG
ncbi:hypothetical protein [Polymorphum gilvum]|uniref:Conserved hypothetical transmembrane protein n=1 Tax=Polymorphum gilvum (strain LMG 25793 / CGMCC 1.9160 / SL003B-26A1) TaxID=991905 RepID=F2J412_POLGS|nr:hypothetical protein [Polymorphum gilvum]ADZ69938.1 Conserved hypothetical transmembrane protein [Polymorphum gilvum SL003B-26A1]